MCSLQCYLVTYAWGAFNCEIANPGFLQIALHSTDDSKSDEEVVWRDTDWKTVPYREYPWTLSAMQVSVITPSAVTHS